MVLVTGGVGFIGSSIVQRLISQKRAVRILTFRKKPQFLGRFEEIEGDIRDKRTLEEAFKDVDVLIHLAAIIREKGGQTFIDVNFLGTRNVLGMAKKFKVRKIIHFSALGVKNDSRFPYLYSKWLGEQEVLKSSLPYTIFKPSIIFGEGDQFTNRLAKMIKIPPLFPIIGNGQTRFQPMWVEDVTKCVWQILQNGKFDNKIFEIGGPQILTYEEVCDIIMAVLGKKRIKIHLPLSLMKVLVLPLQILPNPPVTPIELSMLAFDNIGEEKSVERTFGFEPKKLQEAISYLLRN